MTAPVLVIGIGSELRTDDAAGRRVAEEVAARGLTGVEVRSVHQLAPELAAQLDGRRHVVFVDAAADAVEVTVADIDGGGRAEPLTHHLDPAALVALARGLGWSVDRATAVQVPVRDLGFGTELDPVTERVCARAADLVAALCAGVG